MEIEDKVEERKGKAYTIKANDLIPQYIEGVKQFLRDNQLEMGDKWVKEAGNRLYNFSGKNKEGDIIGLSTDMGVAIATFCPEVPLITGQQLLGLYKRNGNKNPFGSVYIDFGACVIGNPNTNKHQAKILLQDLKKRKIALEKGRVLDFAQLRLIADKEAGLAYKLAEAVSTDDIALVSDYPFKDIGENGLFRAYLYWGSYFGAFDDCLGGSSSGLVVGF